MQTSRRSSRAAADRREKSGWHTIASLDWDVAREKLDEVDTHPIYE